VQAVPGVQLRPESTADIPFLQQLYASARAREMAQVQHWTQGQKREFLDGQFAAQRAYYRQHYPEASYDVIERDGVPIGRLYVAGMRREVILMDITLLDAERNGGLGTALVQALQSRAVDEGKIASLHVEDENPARRLYDRLGFVEVAAVTFYKLMHWVPEGLQALSDELAAEARAQAQA